MTACPISPSRLAVAADVPDLVVVMDAAIAELQRAYLADAQIESSRAIMGIDTELIAEQMTLAGRRPL